MAKVRRSSSDPMVIARARGPEFTNVSDETERKIPFRTWLTCAAVSMVDVLSLVGILVLVSRQFWNWKHPPRIYGHSWGAGVWRGLSIWSPSIGIVILFFVMLWSVPLLYRFLVETVAKHPPQYTPYPSELGLWNPLGHGLEDDGEEYEADADDMAQDDRPYIVKGEMMVGSKSKLYLEFELENYAAALKWHKFCKAVQSGKNFSYNEAVRQHKLSPGDWKRIYKAFTAQQWAVPAGRRGTPELKAVGKHWVKLYAANPPVVPPSA